MNIPQFTFSTAEEHVHFQLSEHRYCYHEDIIHIFLLKEK